LDNADGLFDNVEEDFFDPLVAVFVDHPNKWTSSSWAWGAGLLTVFLIMLLCICSTFWPETKSDAKNRELERDYRGTSPSPKARSPIALSTSMSPRMRSSPLPKTKSRDSRRASSNRDRASSQTRKHSSSSRRPEGRRQSRPSEKRRSPTEQRRSESYHERYLRENHEVVRTTQRNRPQRFSSNMADI
jgi:hypothetical protein